VYVTNAKLDTLKTTNEVARQGFVSAADRARQLDCLTRNIYWESATEPFEGKVAVAQVTINRVESGRFAPDICGVVYQKNMVYDKVICQFMVLRWIKQDPTHISGTLERVRRSGQKGPAGRFQTAQCEKRTLLSCGLCKSAVG
jgi:hypothetical protein